MVGNQNLEQFWPLAVARVGRMLRMDKVQHHLNHFLEDLAVVEPGHMGIQTLGGQH
jgi:hypothetical protein